MPQGRVLKSLLGQGVASVGDPTQCHAVAIDGRAPKFDGGIATRLDCVPFSIVVNKHGQRFYDEGEDVWPKRYAIWGRLVAQQPDQVAYAIIDSRSERLFMPSVFPAIKADTIGELAAKLGLDPAALEATVAALQRRLRARRVRQLPRSTACTPQGLDPPKTNWARPITEPPFIGYPLRPGITFTYLGVKVNERAQVIMEDGRPAANLFASGEIMAGSILGKGYLAGFGMAIGTVFGRIAGREAAQTCPKLIDDRDATAAMLEARRAMEVCNACRYCEGFCAVFPAMELRREFADRRPQLPRQPLPLLPRLLLRLPIRAAARVRHQRAPRARRGSRRELRAIRLARPARRGSIERNGLVMALAMAAGIGGVLLLAMLLQRHAVLFAPQPVIPGPGLLRRRPLRRDGRRRLGHLPLLAARPGHRLRPLLARHRRHGGRTAPAHAAAAGAARRGDAALSRRRRPWLQRPRRELLQPRAATCHHADGLRLPALLRLHLAPRRSTTTCSAGPRPTRSSACPCCSAPSAASAWSSAPPGCSGSSSPATTSRRRRKLLGADAGLLLLLLLVGVTGLLLLARARDRAPWAWRSRSISASSWRFS